MELLCSQSQQFLSQISNSVHQSWGSWRRVRGTFASIELHPFQMKYTFLQWCWVNWMCNAWSWVLQCAFFSVCQPLWKGALPPEISGSDFAEKMSVGCSAVKSAQSIPCQHIHPVNNPWDLMYPQCSGWEGALWTPSPALFRVPSFQKVHFGGKPYPCFIHLIMGLNFTIIEHWGNLRSFAVLLQCLLPSNEPTCTL